VAIRPEEQLHSLGVVVALTDDRLVRARLSDAAGASAEVVTVGSVAELLDAARAARCSVAVVDAGFLGCDPIGAVSAIRRTFPSLPLLAYCDLFHAPPALLVELVQAGVTGLVVPPISESPHALRAAIAAALKNTGGQRVYGCIAPLIPVTLHPLLRYGLSHSHEDASVEHAARSLGLDRKTLRNRLDAVGAPPPREFLGWIQLSVGAFLLDGPGRTSEQVAHMLGFSSGMAFRNMLHRYCGVTIARLRALGGGEFVLDLFRIRLARGRTAHHATLAGTFGQRVVEAITEQSA
jgi:DNA-binding NarL/FixJ family response regulator